MIHGTSNSYNNYKCRCDPCTSAWADYLRGRAETAKYRKSHRNKLKLAVDKLKSIPCVDCNTIFPPECMDFDHINGDKEFGISEAVGCMYSWKRILKEIEKCEIVCSNCHRIRTHQRL